MVLGVAYIMAKESRSLPYGSVVWWVETDYGQLTNCYYCVPDSLGTGDDGVEKDAISQLKGLSFQWTMNKWVNVSEKNEIAWAHG